MYVCHEQYCKHVLLFSMGRHIKLHQSPTVRSPAQLHGAPAVTSHYILPHSRQATALELTVAVPRVRNECRTHGTRKPILLRFRRDGTLRPFGEHG